jgi:hypothetical protein
MRHFACCFREGAMTIQMVSAPIVDALDEAIEKASGIVAAIRGLTTLASASVAQAQSLSI